MYIEIEKYKRMNSDDARPAPLDQADRRILAVLQKQGRLTNQQLAEQVNMSAASCWRRVRSLEERGVIDGFAALLNRKRAGFGFCVFVHITLARHVAVDVREFEAALQAREEVLECYAMAGAADFLLRVVAPDIESYDRFLEDFIFTLPGLGQVNSSIALREIKFDVALPISGG